MKSQTSTSNSVDNRNNSPVDISVLQGEIEKEQVLPTRLTNEVNNYEDALDNKAQESRAVEIMSKHFPETVDKETGHKLPYRTIYQGRKLRLSKNRLWLFQSFGGFTMTEIQQFVKAYSKELTLDEQAAINLYLKEASGDREASQQVWDLHKKIFETMKSVYVEELKQQRSDEEKISHSRMEDLLEKIGEKILETDKNKTENRDK